MRYPGTPSEVKLKRYSKSQCLRAAKPARTSPPLAGGATVEGDDLASRSRIDGSLGQLLGNAKQPLAPPHLGPDIPGLDASCDPQHNQVVHEVGAFLDHVLGLAVHGID